MMSSRSIAVSRRRCAKIRKVWLLLSVVGYASGCGSAQIDPESRLDTLPDRSLQEPPPLPGELRSAAVVEGNGADSLPEEETPRRMDAFAPVPAPRLEPGIGVLAVAEPPGTERVRTDTFRVRTEPSASASERALFLLHNHGGSGWSYELRTDPPARINAVEFAYEEKGLPFDSLAGRWARVIYGWPADGPPLRGWVSLAESQARTLFWTDLLRQRNLFWEDPADARFYAAPGGSAVDIRLTPPGISWASYDIVPVRTDGPWMQVRVVVPSICSDEPGSVERLAWIRYLDAAGRPLVWPRTRGC